MSVSLLYLKSEKSELKLKNFIPKNYSMFIDSIDQTPIEISSILLINNNIYFCRYEDNGSVRINVFTKNGVPLDHIFIPNLPDKTKLRETILNGIDIRYLSFRPNNVYKYKYTPTGEYKTVAAWRDFLSPLIITGGDFIKNLYENGNESININSSDKTYPIISLSTVNTFQINPETTDRIFVYKSDNNKLVHITDYIAKGTTQDVTIDYNLGINSIKSSIIPVNPLPVPNFNVQDENFYQTYDDTPIRNGLSYEVSDQKYYEDSPNFVSTSTWWIIRQNNFDCPKGQILSSDATRCENIYSGSIIPVKSISYDVLNGTEPVLYPNNNGTSVDCGQGVITSYMRRGYGHRACIARGGCTRTRYINRFYKTKCSRLSIE